MPTPNNPHTAATEAPHLTSLPSSNSMVLCFLSLHSLPAGLLGFSSGSWIYTNPHSRQTIHFKGVPSPPTKKNNTRLEASRGFLFQAPPSHQGLSKAQAMTERVMSFYRMSSPFHQPSDSSHPYGTQGGLSLSPISEEPSAD